MPQRSKLERQAIYMQKTQKKSNWKEIRAAAQISMLSRLIPGDIIRGTVSLVEKDAVWIDIGGLKPACLPAERIALSPATSQTARFSKGQKVYAAVLSIHRDTKTIYLTHYELLGTFADNTAGLQVGDRVKGNWLSPRQIELSPNLWGEVVGRVTPSQYEKGGEVEVEILSIDRRLATLTLKPVPLKNTQKQAEAVSEKKRTRTPFRYFQTEGRLRHWVYVPAEPVYPHVDTVFFVHSTKQATR
jgi:small subunit ribosomal protein S1